MRKPRRTQAERREGTIRKVLDAAIESILESGYAGTSMQIVATRAGVSIGGLFRHFPTREALMVAVGQDVARQILARYTSAFESLHETEDPLVLALRLLRDTCRSRINQVWLELVHASRTDAALKKALAPVWKEYSKQIEDLARALLPDLAESLGDKFGLLVDTVVAIFDGEQLHRMLYADRALEAERIDALARVARFLMAYSA
ncbi:MAG TPA: helix-turn-helix domain-containing protein [Polyangiaceae bacterium]|nr:helix-turn-helix domain-containing protein [Polyangiaceae bacterium]